MDEMDIDDAFEEAKNVLDKVEDSDEFEDMDDEEENNMIFSGELGKKKKNEDGLPDEFSDSDQEKEDYTIRKNDSLIVVATAEADHSNLEVYLYDHKSSDLYVHHEIILGAYPLCL